MNILVTGAGGTLGFRLTPKLRSAFGASAIHRCYNSPQKNPESAANTYCGDLTEKRFLNDTLEKSQPHIIINLASLTDVNLCEEKPEKAQLINAELIEQITKFDDKPNPISIYGKTKLAGEEAALSDPDNLVVRTSGLFDSRPGNLFYFFMDNLRRGREVSALSDCWYSPTSAEALSERIIALIENNTSGIVHFAGAERVTRYEFALIIAKSLKCDYTLVKKKCDFNWKARRPRDSSLDSADGYSETRLAYRSLEEELGRLI